MCIDLIFLKSVRQVIYMVKICCLKVVIFSLQSAILVHIVQCWVVVLFVATFKKKGEFPQN